MQRFWKPRREDGLEQFLRANRPQPRDEFVAALTERFATQRQRPRSQRLGRRVLLASAVTALAVGAGVAAGGTHVATTSIANLARVGEFVNHGPNGDKAGKSDKLIHGYVGHEGADDKWAGNYETNVPVCFRTPSRVKHWVELLLPPRVAAFFVRFFPPSFIVGTPGGPNTCPP